MKLHGMEHLRFAVVDESGYVISLHQHPDAAERVIARSPRDDLMWVEVNLRIEAL